MEPVGVVTKFEGQVQVKRASSKGWTKVHLNMPLYPGDVVRTGDSGRVVIWLQVGRPRVIGAKKTETILSVGAQRDSLWREVWQAFTKRMRANLAEESLAAVAAARPILADLSQEKLPTILTPRNTKVLDGRVEFRWREVQGAQGYRVTIGLFEGQNRVYETTATRPPLRYPDDAPALKPGKSYIWQVEAIGVSKSTDSAWFVIVPPPEARDIRFALQRLKEKSSDAITYALMAASFLESRGCYADAFQVLQPALKEAPERADLRLSLAHIYDAIGLDELGRLERVHVRGLIQSLRQLGWQTAAGQ